MLKHTPEQKIRLILFVAALISVACISAFWVGRTFQSYNTASVAYLGIVIAWALTIKKRVMIPVIRRQLLIASFFMGFLFIQRVCRWTLFGNVPVVDEYLRYAYYICFTAIPLCAFLSACCTDKTKEEDPLRHLKWLWLLQVLLSLLAMTNHWHGLLFSTDDIQSGNYEYGPLYFACVAWSAAFSFGAFGVILYKCRISAAKKLWYVPAFFMLFCIGLLVLYYVCGGAPILFGFKVYNIQEVVCALFILPFESMFQIGLVPTNSYYEPFFRLSHAKAAIYDENGGIVFASDSFEEDPERARTLEEGAGESLTEGGEPVNFRMNRKRISGGSVVWTEDLTAIRKIDEEIRRVTEQLEDENELIRQENEILAERISYETKNRLYDKIAGAVRTQAMAIDEILTQELEKEEKKRGRSPGEEERFRRQLIRVAVLGAYVKRMGNLMLAADEKKVLEIRELGSAIAESLDAYQLTGRTCDHSEGEDGECAAELLILAYELLETVLEENYEHVRTLVVSLHHKNGFEMNIGTDCDRKPVAEDWKKEQLKKAGASLSVKFLDDTWYLTLREEVEE